jgi:hypothetical protein
MTCIAAIAHKGTVWMGGDKLRIGAGNGLKRHFVEPKVWRKTIAGVSWIFGHTGDSALAQIFEHVCAFPQASAPQGQALTGFLVREWLPLIRKALQERGELGKHKEDSTDKFASSLLIGIHGRILVLDGAFGIFELKKKYGAIGAGEVAAVTALAVQDKHSLRMSPRARIIEAIGCARELCPSVGSEVTIVHT